MANNEKQVLEYINPQRRKIVGSLVATGAISTGLTAPTIHAAAAESVYMIIQLEITDKDRFFSDYVGPLGPIHQRHGVEVLVGTPKVEVQEGEYNKNFTVVLKFPSAKAKADWYSDPDYQPLKKVRAQTTNAKNSTIIVAPQFVKSGH